MDNNLFNKEGIIKLSLGEGFYLSEILTELIDSEEHFNDPILLKIQDRISETLIRKIKKK